MAHSICEHYHDEECAYWVKLVTGAINFIFAVSRRGARTQGAVGESPDNEVSSFARRTLLAESYADAVAQAFSELGIEHNGIEDVDILSLSHTKRDAIEPDLTRRLIVRGIKTDSFTHDIAFNQYSNGGHVLHLGGLNQSLHANPSSEIAKRASFGQEGLKVSAFVEAPSTLNIADSNEVANAIGEDWVHRAAYNDISEYIGYVMGGSKINFIYRIIPEVQGFGLNYEDVGVCGAVGPPKQ